MNRGAPDVEATRRHWNHQASDYDAAKRRNDGYYRALKHAFNAAIPRELRGRVLDVGCGTGQILASLEPREGLGIDFSEAMIEAARTQLHHRGNLSFRVIPAADAQILPPHFDAVVSADMLEHADDWKRAVAAMVSCCRPGGVIVLSTPSPAWKLPLWLLEKFRLKMPEGPHRFIHRRRIVAHLRALGCTEITSRTHALLPLNLFGMGSTLNALGARLPLLKNLGVIQLITARRGSA